MTLDPRIAAVTDRVIERSRNGRRRYLDLIAEEAERGLSRGRLSCSNLAHGFAAAEADQATLREGRGINLGIVTAYNDMLSAHQPYGRYPEQMKIFAREVGATAQVAGGVPAMCDGVTQGQVSMELSLFSRDVIALSTAVALSHAMFEGVAYLGICDKIVPGLLMAALRFGHLPGIFVPAGPMPSGLPNREKSRIRQLHAEGKVDRAGLLEAESASYHAPGTCTFYGTANSNQMLMEVMGLHVPGAAFVNPGTNLRTALTRAAVHRLAAIAGKGPSARPLGQIIDERSIVNAAVGLLATGGSTNHAIHLPAIARAAGIVFDWTDLDQLSSAVPLIASIYPSGEADVNHFHASGGMAFVIRQLLDAGLLHADAATVWEGGLAAYARSPVLDDGQLAWDEAPRQPGDPAILRPVGEAFRPDGGMRLVEGNLGRAIFKTSAVQQERFTVEATARVFNSQEAVQEAFRAGELDRDVVVVVRFQGPLACGMPELHKLMPPLGVLQDRGHRVALVTDGRLSGASGKVPSAIHLTPEAAAGGPLARVRDGDRVRLCALRGELTLLAPGFAERPAAAAPPAGPGTGRELFQWMRSGADGAEAGASAMLAAAGL
ncbi:phosphogluconate dehydratase [Thermaurantiacus sp.]